MVKALKSCVISFCDHRETHIHLSLSVGLSYNFVLILDLFIDTYIMYIIYIEQYR